MERQIGEVFTYEGKTYQIIPREKEDCCTGCAFNLGIYACKKPRNEARNKFGHCYFRFREDKKGIIFKEINNMENNQLNIKIPEGMEIDIENTDLPKGIIKFRTTNLTYDEVDSTIHNKYGITYELTGMSSHNITKLSNLDKLLDITKYYNKDWEPDWDATYEYKYYIFKHNNKYYIASTTVNNCRIVYFRNIEDAQAVIDNPNFKDILDSIYK